jgi:hypothetical protein
MKTVSSTYQVQQLPLATECYQGFSFSGKRNGISYFLPSYRRHQRAIILLLLSIESSKTASDSTA